MRKLIFITIFTLLVACSPTHEIVIQKKPCLYPLKGYDFTLCESFEFYIDSNHYEVPKGFETDLASVPRIFWSLYSPSRAETIPGAIIHDYFYRSGLGVTRDFADSVFYDALVYEGLPKATAFKYWTAVRLFGSSHFSEYKYKERAVEKNNI